jgi:hypothetical protein
MRKEVAGGAFQHAPFGADEEGLAGAAPAGEVGGVEAVGVVAPFHLRQVGEGVDPPVGCPHAGGAGWRSAASGSRYGRRAMKKRPWVTPAAAAARP